MVLEGKVACPQGNCAQDKYVVNGVGQDKAVAGVSRYGRAHNSRIVPLPVFTIRPGLIARTQQFAVEPTLLCVQLLTS